MEEPGNRSMDAAAARGDAALQKLEQTSEQLSTSLQGIENAANNAIDPKKQVILN